MKDTFVIIDGNNLLFRAFFALPQLSNLDGEISNGVFGFTNMLTKIIKDINPKYIAVCFDSAHKTFRHDMFKEYKGTRNPAPKELLDQFPILFSLLDKMHIKYLKDDMLEADDLIGCLSRMYDTQNIVVSADKDCFQLINDNTKVLKPQKGITDSVLLDEKLLKEMYGVTPSQIIELKSLMGDPSDNIPGVQGIGEKTALSLLNKYSSLDGVYNNIELIGGKMHQKLLDCKEIAYLSHTLATIVVDKKLDYKLDDFTYDFPFDNNVLEMFKRYQFNSLLKRDELFEIGAREKSIKENKIKVINIQTADSLQSLIQSLLSHDEIALNITPSVVNVFDGLNEYAICMQVNLIDAGFDFDNTIRLFKPVFEKEGVKKIVLDSKSLKHSLLNFDIHLNNVSFDVLVARYIINGGGKTDVTIETLIQENLLDPKTPAFDLYEIKNVYAKRIIEQGQDKVYYNIELPLVDVLVDMENQGFKIDREQLNQQKLYYEQQIELLTKQIYEVAGHEFNIQSPSQLAHVLFDEMGLYSYNNKKQSTNAQVLDELYGLSPIIPLIISFRKMTKIYNTYIISYLDLVNEKNEKVHTVFNQTLTSTGRLSSSEPNLQNIPVRTEEGKNIRKLFVPSFDNGYIVSSDYSQIELRLLASFSGDEKLINAFNTGIDIHALTASEIFKVDVDKVSELQRRSAKAINFGIVYGISDYGLSQNINIPVQQAKEYISEYFVRYPKIKEYMEHNVAKCKECGYITTLFGRRRSIPEINNTKYMLRTFGERAAMNMPLQGSASDVIKLAMIKVYDELKNQKLESKLILQVHDELLIDTKPSELEKVEKLLKDCMENVVDLQVKLTVNVGAGHTWYDC